MFLTEIHLDIVSTDCIQNADQPQCYNHCLLNRTLNVILSYKIDVIKQGIKLVTEAINSSKMV